MEKMLSGFHRYLHVLQNWLLTVSPISQSPHLTLHLIVLLQTPEICIYSGDVGAKSHKIPILT